MFGRNLNLALQSEHGRRRSCRGAGCLSVMLSFASNLRERAAGQPDLPALTVVAGTATETSWTYAELDAASNRVGQALLAAGVGTGDRVAHLGRNRAGYVALLHGASKVRAAIVGLNWRLTAGELAPLLADAAPRVVVVDDEFRPALEAAIARAGVEPVIRRGDAVEEWSASHPATDPGDVPQPDDIALVFYTSGTTGVPKGALLPVASIAANLARPVPWRMRPGSIVLVCSPVFHTAGTGWIYLPLYFGAHCLLLRDPGPAQILGAIEEHGVTQAMLVPAVIQMVMNDPGMPAPTCPAWRRWCTAPHRSRRRCWPRPSRRWAVSSCRPTG